MNTTTYILSSSTKREAIVFIFCNFKAGKQITVFMTYSTKCASCTYCTCSAVHVNTCVRTFGSSIHTQQINIYIFYVKMFDINICNAITGEIVCVIFDVDPDLTLDNLRKRIENEAREFITKDFRFTMAGVTLSLGQEEIVLVTNAIKRNGEEAIIMFQECMQFFGK